MNDDDNMWFDDTPDDEFADIPSDEPWTGYPSVLSPEPLIDISYHEDELPYIVDPYNPPIIDDDVNDNDDPYDVYDDSVIYEPLQDDVPPIELFNGLNFNPEDADNDSIVGNPSDAIQEWHQQAYDDTCAISSQEFILDSITGQDFNEDDLRQQAIDNGWYTPGGGTPLDQIGNLLEANGIEVERGYERTLDDLESQLAHGGHVIVALDSEELWTSEQNLDDVKLSQLPWLPDNQVDHAVQVIGIDRSDVSNPMVILNDPGHPDGKGMMVPLNQFVDAWGDSDNFMMNTKN
jgi:hypothetical protein